MKLRNVKRRRRRKRLGWDDPKYLKWIRRLPCLCCAKLNGLHGDRPMLLFLAAAISSGQVTPTEAHHAGDHGYAQKPPDKTAVPLCAEHHRIGEHAAHALGKKFWTYWQIDRDEMVAALNKAYESYCDLRT